MKIIIYYIGKEKKNHFSDIEALFLKRIKHYAKVEIKRIKPEKLSSSLSVNEIRKKEELLLIQHIKKEAAVILLDEGGKQYSSKAFSNYLESLMSTGPSTIAFAIGGAYGFSDGVKAQYKNIISLSQLTFAHHLARAVLLEQVYRAFTIINNEPYHNS